MIIADLNVIIEDSEMHKNKPDFVKDIANDIIENRKHETQRRIDEEQEQMMNYTI